MCLMLAHLEAAFFPRFHCWLALEVKGDDALAGKVDTLLQGLRV